MKPRLLDGCCGSGGATKGYQLAGWHVTGVDMSPQPRYVGDAFVQGDVLEAILTVGHLFDAIHVSPPCQPYSRMLNRPQVRDKTQGHPARKALIPVIRDLLIATGRPYVIENVEGARKHMIRPVLLCGASFGLGAAGLDLPRHRLFETSFAILTPPCSHRRGKTMGVYGHGMNQWHRDLIGRNITMAERKEAMGIDWMRRGEDSQAIPPAYTEFIGRQLMRYVANNR